MARLPMFPLEGVLLPGQVLPLHVFEPRYRALVQRCLDGPPEFGVTLIERGREVGGGDLRSDAGTVAKIVEAAELRDGRWVLATVGVQRIRVQRWLADDPHPWAEVDDWPDPPPGANAKERHVEAISLLRKVLALQAECGKDVAPSTIELSDDPVAGSYQLAAIAPLGPFDRQGLLVSPTVDERLDAIVRLLEEQASVLRQLIVDGG